MMHMTEKIAKEESTYERALLTAAKAVTGDRAAKVVLITGGSCAGKTTTTKKLSQYIPRRRPPLPHRLYRRFL